MITTTILKSAHVVYTINVAWCHTGPFYVGACPLGLLYRLPDARQNSEFATHLNPDDPITLAILAIVVDPAEASRMRDATAQLSNAWCNKHGTTAAIMKRVRNIDTAEIFDSPADAARHANVTRQAMSGHLCATGAKTIGGHKYERIE